MCVYVAVTFISYFFQFPLLSPTNLTTNGTPPTRGSNLHQVSLAEREFAAMVEMPFALGVNSCSSAILLALMAVGTKAGDEVITNGFTFTALPSTIMRLGAKPVLVEATKVWAIPGGRATHQLSPLFYSYPPSKPLSPPPKADPSSVHPTPRARAKFAAEQ